MLRSAIPCKGHSQPFPVLFLIVELYDCDPDPAEVPAKSILSLHLNLSPFAIDANSSSNEAEHSLANPRPYCSTAHLNSPLKNVTNNDDPPTQGHLVPQAPVKTYRMSRRKKYLNKPDLLALIVLIVCFVASIVTISPRMMFAWRLGLKRQVSQHCLQLAL